MTESMFIELLQDAIWLIVLLSAPLLIINLVVGLGISIFQAVTQIQESTLTFVPKILASFLILILAGPWMTQMVVDYTGRLLDGMARVGQVHK